MKYLLILLVLLLVGCSSEKIVYVDSNSGQVIEPKKKLQKFTQEVVCNEFGVAYYITDGYGNGSQYNVYTPVLKPYFHNGSSYNNPTVTCKEYENLK
jgi:hypothetical protein